MIKDKQEIVINELVKYYNGSETPAVGGISMSISNMEIFGLLGPNGAGKTTIINILSGLITPTGGNVTIGGYSLRDQRDKIKPIFGVVPQDIALYPNLTCIENLNVFGRLFKLRGKEFKNKVDNLLEAFGLEQKRKKRVNTFSGGMKRRLNIIAGIIHDPKVLFLDEPTVGIDVQSKAMIIENLKELNKKGTTMIYTSHQMEEAETFCSRIGIIDAGHLIERGKPDELISKYEGCKSLEDVYLSLTGRSIRD